MDWSLLQRHAPHPFLRSELVYGDYIPVYYFAIVTNVIIRFIWVIYAPPGRLGYKIRSVSAAGLEMLRRFQWNFFRVENEHLGNADQYRVTREMPLPYSLTNAENQDDSDSDEEDKRQPLQSSEDSAQRRPPITLSRESFAERPPGLRSVRLTPMASDEEQLERPDF